jgi:hypothetical protein
MARPLQLEFAGIFHHITSRADRREAIYKTDADRQVAVSGMRIPLLAMRCLLSGGQAYALNDMQRFAKLTAGAILGVQVRERVSSVQSAIFRAF